MRRSVSLVLIASLFSLSLAGCGTNPAALSQAPRRTVAADAAPIKLSAAQYAQKFAMQIQAQGGQRPEVEGARVVVRAADGEPDVYDFSETPRTGKVLFKAGDLETRFEWSDSGEISGKALPAILVAVAVKMVWGGTKAFIRYWIKHPGDEFSKHDCVKAVVYGMVAEGLTAIPVVGGVLSSVLWPIAWKWVGKWLDEHLPWDARKILGMGMEFKGEIAEALQEALAQSQQ